MPCLAASHLPSQMPAVGSTGALARGLCQCSVVRPSVAEFLALGRPLPVRSSVGAQRAVGKKAGFIGAVHEGADSLGRFGLWSFGRALTLSRRTSFARRFSSVSGRPRAKAHLSCPEQPTSCSAALTAARQPSGPNRRFEGTACKLRLQVPRRLRRRAAPQAKR